MVPFDAVVLVFAVVSSLLVFVHVYHFHPWRLWSKHEWPVYYLFCYSVAIAGAISITSYFRLKSHIALQLLLELTWLNGLGGQVYTFQKICSESYRIEVALIAAVAVLIQVVGFGLSQTRYSEKARGFFIAGAILFQVLPAGIAADCLHKLHIKTRPFVFFTAAFIIAVAGILGISAVLTKDWFFLANNILQCSVNFFIIVLRYSRRLRLINWLISRTLRLRDNFQNASSVTESWKGHTEQMQSHIPHAIDHPERNTPSISLSTSTYPLYRAPRKDEVLEIVHASHPTPTAEDMSAQVVVESNTQKGIIHPNKFLRCYP
ncbi:uncharacterized protein EI97DRAFT_433981 [Westerdykella ornata]|uniref:Uncharacterized protein n=1 Tax=Westerdykella ornata TaxID=318751 RepID=A0A6A6JHJ1_WESOR|nr:uncharacterized protein EI97DRAFT_433981 [Westerdykella ornata]KAF2275573.1 hypothetical protein EI97DRAFT_433981 [Westerdykella ornata]